MDEQILHLLGGPKTPKIVDLLSSPLPCSSCSYPQNGGLQGSVVGGRDTSLGSAATPETRLAHYLSIFPKFSALCLPLTIRSHPNICEHYCLTLSLILVSAPRLCRSFTTSKWPPRQAQCMAVQSSWKGRMRPNYRASGRKMPWRKGPQPRGQGAIQGKGTRKGQGTPVPGQWIK